MSDFSLHTLGLIYIREHKISDFLTFVNEDSIARGIHVISLPPGDFSHIAGAARHFQLDFDDAYQYAVAEHYGLSPGLSFGHDVGRAKKGESRAKGPLGSGDPDGGASNIL